MKYLESIFQFDSGTVVSIGLRAQSHSAFDSP